METVDNVIRNSGGPDQDSSGKDARSTSDIVQSVEAQVSLTLQEEGRFSIQTPSVQVEAVKLDRAEAAAGPVFASVALPGQEPPREGSLSGTEARTFTNGSQIPKGVLASVRLPPSIIKVLGTYPANIIMSIETYPSFLKGYVIAI